MKWLPAIFIALILPLVYITVLTVIGVIPTTIVFSADLIAMVVTAVVSGVLGGITGYAVGSSNGSAAKDNKTTAV